MSPEPLYIGHVACPDCCGEGHVKVAVTPWREELEYCQRCGGYGEVPKDD